MRALYNNKGSILIISYTVLFVLLTVAAGIALFNVNEVNQARRYAYTTKAFWLAEAGISLYLKNPDIIEEGKKVIDEPDGQIILRRTDRDLKKRFVYATGVVNGTEATVSLEFPAKPPLAMFNTLTVKGNIRISGRKTNLIINDRTRLSGEIKKRSSFGHITVEDKAEKVDPALVQVLVPDMNHNGQVNEFDDFIAHNREMLSQYDEDEVLYIRGDDTYFITSRAQLKNKKIVYIEGVENRAHVVIPFSAFQDKGEQLTIITTGKVTLNQGGKMAKGAQLNIISWGDYTETAAVPGSLRGIILTFGQAHFEDIYETSVTSGSVIAMDGMVFGDVWAAKIFHYADLRVKGFLPSGFEGLGTVTSTGYETEPRYWKQEFFL